MRKLIVVCQIGSRRLESIMIKTNVDFFAALHSIIYGPGDLGTLCSIFWMTFFLVVFGTVRGTSIGVFALLASAFRSQL